MRIKQGIPESWTYVLDRPFRPLLAVLKQLPHLLYDILFLLSGLLIRLPPPACLQTCNPSLHLHRHVSLLLRIHLGIAQEAVVLMGIFYKSYSTPLPDLASTANPSAPAISTCPNLTTTSQQDNIAAVYIFLLRAQGVEAEARAVASLDDLRVLGQLVTSITKNKIP